MKRLITIVFCLFSITTTYAQNIDFTKVEEDKVKERNKKTFEEKKHKVGFNAGVGVAFAEVGVLGSGSSFNFTYEYFIINNFSATLNYGSSINGSLGLDETYSFSDDNGNFDDTYYRDAQSDLFKMNYVLSGVKYSLGSNVVKVYLNPSIGMSFLSVGPRTLERQTDNNSPSPLGFPIINTNVETFESEKSSSFMLGCSLGTDVRVSNFLSINLGMTLLNSTHGEILGLSERGNYQFTYSAINYSLGLNFLF
tara:strand:- start:952 stop:1707 length:756 start_codon:yes stop_codon:yes gene_type:complete